MRYYNLILRIKKKINFTLNFIMFAKIHKLPEEVINRIAAGEIVQRPSSAIKELLENSIDADSNQISVLCIDSGFTRIEISDNGHGITSVDFPLLCERFATSKINEFNDLKSVSSFGFRGEALASISFVGDLTIRSKTPNSVLGFKAKFRYGKIIEKSEEAIQMNPGTIIECDNLFYNLSVRRNSFSQREEFKEILKLVYKLSIHHYDIKFNLRSSNEKTEFSSFNSLCKDKLRRIELISNIYKIPDHNLLSFDHIKEEYKISIEMICSEVGSVRKMRELHLFINERLVESEHIKKIIENTYKTFWNSIHDNEGGYYCYIKLNMKQENIDVNVDPRKKYVKFVFEEEIGNEIRRLLEAKLKEKCSIRDYSVVSIKNTHIPIVFKHENKNEDKKITYDKNLVRVDPNIRKISSFFRDTASKSNKDNNDLQVSPNKEFFPNLDELVFALMKRNKDQCDQDTTKFFHMMCYVGCLNSNYILVQLEQSLYMINVIPMCLEIFYLKTLTNLQRFETYEVNIDIRNCLNSLLVTNKITEIELEEKIKV